MALHSNQKVNSFSRTTLVLEVIALFGFGLAFMTESWISDAGSPPLSAILGALCLFVAVCVGVIAAVMLIVNIFRGKIDVGTIIAVLPFLGFSAWGVWYSYTDPHWMHNRVFYWGLLVAVAVLLLYTIARYVKLRRG